MICVSFFEKLQIREGLFSALVQVTTGDIFLGLGSFFSVVCGGLAIGLVFGLLTALITRLSSGVRVIEPLALLGFAYLVQLETKVHED